MKPLLIGVAMRQAGSKTAQVQASLAGSRPCHDGAEMIEESTMAGTIKIVSTPTGPRCVLPSGEALQGVTRIAWSAEVDDIARAEVTLFTGDVDVKGVLETMMRHPTTGDIAPIASITFADGTTWSPTAA